MEPQDWVAIDGAPQTGSSEPRWRVRVTPLPWWKKWFDRRLAQADVSAPDQKRYHVRVLRDVPFRGSPLGPFDNVLPTHISLPILIGTNAVARGRTGWVVEVVRAETAWRAKRVIYSRKLRGGTDVADAAIALASAVQRGEQPWNEDGPIDLLGRARRIMNWD